MKCVILAAGLSKRMEGANKLLLPWSASTIIETVITTALSFTDEVYIVTGNERDRIMDKAEHYPIREIYNPDYTDGQETSIRAACRILDDELCFVPGDMPLITKAHYERAKAGINGFLSARPMFNEKPGHPVIIASKLINVINSEPNMFVKDIIKAHSHNFYIDDEAVILDIDTKAEYERLKNK